jgi:hypothetical protein
VSLESLALHESVDDTEGIAVTSLNIASIHLDARDLEAARPFLEVGYEQTLELGFQEMNAYGIGHAAELALRLGRLEDAGELLGAFDAVFTALGSAPQPEPAARRDRVHGALAGRIDVGAAIARGRTLTRDETALRVRDVLAAVRVA